MTPQKTTMQLTALFKRVETWPARAGYPPKKILFVLLESGEDLRLELASDSVYETAKALALLQPIALAVRIASVFKESNVRLVADAVLPVQEKA